MAWKPEARGYLRDLTRDGQGRWYLAWSTHVVDVHSPERVLLGSILIGGEGSQIRYRDGYLYMQYFPGHSLVRIMPGF